MKILVTGSEGLTGGEAVDFFSDKGHDVVGIDNNTRSEALGTPSKHPELNIDIRNESEVNTLFAQYKFDVVIHCAGQASHHRFQNSPLIDFDINARATVILLDAARKNNKDCVFVYCSSDKVFGESMKASDLKESSNRFHSDHPFSESLSIDNGEHSLFGASKLAADIYVKEFGYAFNMKTVCFRLGCITGKRHEGSHFHGFLSNTVRCIKNEETFYLQGFSKTDNDFKGKQVRDNIHSYDLVNAMWHFIQKPKVAAVYNMGGGPERSCSVLEAIAIAEEKTGKKAKIEYIEQHNGDRAWDIHDVSKFKNDYPDWDYQYSLDDIFTELCNK